MKKILVTLSILFSLTTYANDMSQTEEWDDAYIDREFGYLYRGGCSLHEHYLNETFKELETSLHTINPTEMNKSEFKKSISVIDSKLLSQIKKDFGNNFLKNADDLTITEINYLLDNSKKLTRLNVGVGGGNGTYIFYASTNTGYKKVAQTFDGDVTFCDISVWIK